MKKKQTMLNSFWWNFVQSQALSSLYLRVLQQQLQQQQQQTSPSSSIIENRFNVLPLANNAAAAATHHHHGQLSSLLMNHQPTTTSLLNDDFITTTTSSSSSNNNNNLRHHVNHPQITSSNVGQHHLSTSMNQEPSINDKNESDKTTTTVGENNNQWPLIFNAYNRDLNNSLLNPTKSNSQSSKIHDDDDDVAQCVFESILFQICHKKKTK